ncbi:MAG: VIT family protein [Pseudoprimorskyibacter sp.]|nr:VIT family protein [Pseudoprimorskyibacter sp.]
MLNSPHDNGELHYVARSGWLRAAVLGANDGIISTASLVIGVAAAGADQGAVLLAGVAGTVAGAMSMAAGEFVSVSSQSDTELADLDRECRELHAFPQGELEELAATFEARGVMPDTAMDVARQLSDHDALAAHAREELGITDLSTARPLQAAGASAASFLVGALVPVTVVMLAPSDDIGVWVVGSTGLALAALGALGATVGGASPLRGAFRVMIWGSLAMASTAAVGALFNIAL